MPEREPSENTPDRSRQRFPGISSRAYEHPADRTALVALRKIDGFDVLLRKLSGFIDERKIRLSLLADGVKVGDLQFPRLQAMLQDSVDALDLGFLPELYVVQNPVPNAFTIGMDRPAIVLSTGLYELMDEEEMRWVVGHEVGHVLSGHAVYRTMLFWLTNLATKLSWMPVGKWGIDMFINALLEWYRKAELSCDRAGLLVEQDLDAAMRALMKLAGGSHLAEMNPVAFLEQAREHEGGGGLRESILKLLSLQGRTHPYTSIRALELTRWVESGDYQHPRRADDPQASVREEAKAAAGQYKENFERTTDPLLSKVRGFADEVAGVGSRIGETMYRKWGPNRGEEGAAAPEDES
ncbi:MAG: M48 family metallopeptidase [Catenulisporales bacterium]|nr:M48 family metallopeptidase [Catenulisporales bacterium]